jgi:hypothetical protein
VTPGTLVDSRAGSPLQSKKEHQRNNYRTAAPIAHSGSLAVLELEPVQRSCREGFSLWVGRITCRVPIRHQGLDVCRNIRLLSAFFDQEAPMDANSGEPWTEMDIQDLRASLDFGNTYADAASMLRRDEDEVRRKAKELGLVEHRKKW